MPQRKLFAAGLLDRDAGVADAHAHGAAAVPAGRGGVDRDAGGGERAAHGRLVARAEVEAGDAWSSRPSEHLRAAGEHRDDPLTPRAEPLDGGHQRRHGAVGELRRGAVGGVGSGQHHVREARDCATAVDERDADAGAESHRHELVFGRRRDGQLSHAHDLHRPLTPSHRDRAGRAARQLRRTSAAAGTRGRRRRPRPPARRRARAPGRARLRSR